MTERINQNPILGPTSKVLETLADAKFTPAKHIKKPTGQEIYTRLVEKGSGMVGLENPAENQEWSGMFNHFVKTAGAAIQIGELLQLNGQSVDISLMLNTVMLSHSGRRQSDEARWYPTEVKDADKKKVISDTQIGVANLKERKLPNELVDAVSVHGLGQSFPFDGTKTWNQKLPMYLDFRIAQNAMPMESRFIDLKRGVSDGRFTQDFLDKTKQWAEGVEKELFTALTIPSYKALIDNPKNLKSRIDIAIKLGKFTDEEAQKLKELTLYKPKVRGGKDGDVAIAVGLTADQILVKLQLKPEDINDKLLKPERWERYIRRLYLNDAEKGIFTRLSKLYEDIKKGKEKSAEELEREFPMNTWWGEYAREVYNNRKGKPLENSHHKELGIKRAIDFYSKIEEKRKKKATSKS